MLPIENPRMRNLILAPPITKHICCGLWIPCLILREQDTQGIVKGVAGPTTAEVEDVDAFSPATVVAGIDDCAMVATATNEL